jgi:hypothetical protein
LRSAVVGLWQAIPFFNDARLSWQLRWTWIKLR